MRGPVVLLVASLVAGCALPADDAGDGSPDGEPASTRSFAGTVSGTPRQPGKASFPFDVPAGADAIEAELSFPEDQDLFFLLIDPAGVQTQAHPDGAGRARALTEAAPAAGAWTARVTAVEADGAAFTLDVTVHEAPPADARESGSATIGRGRFVEVNALANAGATFEWSFAASAPVTWDLHSHLEGRAATHASGKSSRGEGAAFTAPARGLYSLFVILDEGASADVSWSIEGAFRLHSVTT